MVTRPANPRMINADAAATPTPPAPTMPTDNPAMRELRVLIEVLERGAGHHEVVVEAYEGDRLPLGLHERGQRRDDLMQLVVRRGIDREAHAHPSREHARR